MLRGPYLPFSVAGWLFLSLGALLAARSLPAQEVTRNLANPANAAWQAGRYSTATVQVSAVPERPAESAWPANAPASLRVTLGYAGAGFQQGLCGPVQARIPGRCLRVAVWLQPLDAAHSWLLQFQDAQGKDKVGEQKLEMPVKAKPGQWTQQTFTIPADWPQPLTLVGVVGHNWNDQKTKTDASLLVHNLRVTTDISGIPDQQTLLTVNVDSGREGNVFTSGGVAPAFTVRLTSWLSQPLAGTVVSTLTDEAGATVATSRTPLALDDAQTIPVPLALKDYGTYHLTVELQGDNGWKRSATHRLAWVPAPLKQPPAEQRVSPWGINIHGGIEGVAYQGIAAAGFTWIRDYAYAWDWMQRARGDDNKFAGWPWYPQMDAKARAAGLLVMPCLMKGIGEPIDKQALLAPDRAWKVDLLRILMAFPQYSAWELDNEYDLQHGGAEAQRQWRSYQDYHRAFGQTVKFLDDSAWTVENGAAGLYPERVAKNVASGAFKDIDVINGHYYCGTAPPEIAVTNANTGGGDEPPALVYDRLRDLVTAASSDGRARQTWITEFGWDTLAVHIVSEAQQAAYLQRGFVLGRQAGISKLFWYWNLDTKKEQPDTFFDGCGIFDRNQEPKPALAAAAGLTHLLVQPVPLGTFDFGPNSMGHLFRDRGRLVACAFQVDPALPAPAPQFKSGTLYDLNANRVATAPATLGLAPLWADGVDEQDPIVKQACYDLASRYLVRATAGDHFTVQLRARNPRTTALAAHYQVTLPAGWSATPAAGELAAAPNETREVPLVIQLPAAGTAPTGDVLINVDEGGTVKHLVVKVMLLPAGQLTCESLGVTPGADNLVVHLRNNSVLPRAYRLRLTLPKSWSAPATEIPVPEVAAGAIQDVTVPLTWSLAWTAAETAEVAVLASTGEVLDHQGIRPGAWAVPGVAAGALPLDGTLDKWPAAARLPASMLGHRGLDGDADLYLAHSPAGLYVAVVVRGSDGVVTAPKSFWTTHALELFLDAVNDKHERREYAPTDHQFWCCPLVAENRPYLGRWQRFKEIKSTLFDLPGVTGTARTSGTGYVLQFLLPAAQISGWKGGAGTQLGLNLNLTIPGAGGRSGQTSEVFWPHSKQGLTAQLPASWGTLYLR